MYYQNYEDYMRSVLGYPIQQNTYEIYPYAEVPYETSQIYSHSVRYSDEIMDLYPEIYKVVNPMVCKICDINTKPITRELINQMTDEIYMNLETDPETDTIVNVRVNTSNEGEKTEKNSRTSVTTQNTMQNRASKTKLDNEKSEMRQSEIKEDRQRRPNNSLKDLIRILILNRLLGGFPGRPPRPQPPRPPRPPMRPNYPREDRYYNECFKY